MLTDFDWRVRAAVYRTFIERGAAPDAARLAESLGAGPADVSTSLRALAASHVLALDGDDLWMAHPFSAVPTPYPVEIPDRPTYWANCAWDALGIIALIGGDGESATACPDCDRPLQLVVEDNSLEATGAVVHFLVPAAQFWDDIGFT